jgi:biopolymer transport protein ExbD
MRFASQSPATDQKLMDLVPVVNVVLLLVFFFLLSWSFVLQPGVEVRLPAPSFISGNPQGRHVITLKASGNDVLYFFDEKNVDPEGLKKYLNEAAEKNRGDWITLNSDENVSYGRTSEIATQIMALGFHVTMATQQAPVTASPPSSP